MSICSLHGLVLIAMISVGPRSFFTCINRVGSIYTVKDFFLIKVTIKYTFLL